MTGPGPTTEGDPTARRPARRWLKRATVLLIVLALTCLSWLAYLSYVRSILASPLIAAVSADDRSRVAALLAEGADPNARAFPPRPFDLVGTLRSLFLRSRRPPKEAYPTALMLACGQGHARIADLLLRRGADPELRGPAGTTALHEAVRANTETVQVLLDHRAHTELKDASGETPLLRAVHALASPDAEDNGVPTLLVERGASPRAADPRGFSAMSYAAEAGDTRLYEPLLAHGADPDAPRPSGGTALLAALELGEQWSKTDTVRLLLRYRANPNARYEGRTPFLGTLGRGDLRMFRLLLASGGDPNTADQRGRTMLCRAIARRMPDAVDLLLRAGADPNRKSEGRGPLLDAVQARERRAMALLLAHGADPNSTDTEGTTPLMIATFNDDAAAVRALLAAGARPRLADSEGITAIQLASTSPPIAALLRGDGSRAPVRALSRSRTR